MLQVPDVMDKLFKLVQNTEESIQIRAVWTISNIAADSSEHLEFILGSASYVKQIFDISLNGSLNVRIFFLEVEMMNLGP